MKLIYGTGNNAKLNAMRTHLKEIGIDVIGLSELNYPWPNVDESGNNPLENARIKASAYYNICHMPIFSCDSGLYIEGLEYNRQPGVHVRNVNGKRLDDKEMIDYYAGIAKRLGGRCIAGYKNAICLIMNEKEVYEYMGEDISGEKFELNDTPHSKTVEGFPLDSLSIHIETGKYYFDLAHKELVDNSMEGFKSFFKRTFSL